MSSNPNTMNAFAAEFNPQFPQTPNTQPNHQQLMIQTKQIIDQLTKQIQDSNISIQQSKSNQHAYQQQLIQYMSTYQQLQVLLNTSQPDTHLQYQQHLNTTGAQIQTIKNLMMQEASTCNEWINHQQGLYLGIQQAQAFYNQAEVHVQQQQQQQQYYQQSTSNLRPIAPPYIPISTDHPPCTITNFIETQKDSPLPNGRPEPPMIDDTLPVSNLNPEAQVYTDIKEDDDEEEHEERTFSEYILVSPQMESSTVRSMILDYEIPPELVTTHPLCNPPLHYTVVQLMRAQKTFNFLNVYDDKHQALQWTLSYEVLIEDDPEDERRITLEDIIAQLQRKSEDGYKPVDESTLPPIKILQKRLRGILNKMTPEIFNKLAHRMMCIVGEYAKSRDMMDIVIKHIILYGMTQSKYAGLYAHMCDHISRYLHKLQIMSDLSWLHAVDDVSKLVYNMIVGECEHLFHKQRQMMRDDREHRKMFFGIMIMVGELYNISLVDYHIIFGGLLDNLLVDDEVNMDEIEGCCKLFETCGLKLEENKGKLFEKYIQKLVNVSKDDETPFRIRVLIENVMELRANKWRECRGRVKWKPMRAGKKYNVKQMYEYGNGSGGYKNKVKRYQKVSDGNARGINRSKKLLNGRSKNSNLMFKPVILQSKHKSNSTSISPKVNTPSIAILPSSSSSSMTVHKLISLVSGYIVSGCTDDILLIECNDCSLWSKVIIEIFVNKKATEIKTFVGLLLILFENNRISNGDGVFHNTLIRELLLNLQSSLFDCPFFIKYIALLFAYLYHASYINGVLCIKIFHQLYVQNAVDVSCETVKEHVESLKKEVEKVLRVEIKNEVLAHDIHQIQF